MNAETPEASETQHAGRFPARPAGLIFDCDGVLFDSKDANSAYYNHIRAALGIAPMDEAEASWAHMASTKEVLEAMAGPERFDEAMEIGRHTSYSNLFMPLMIPEPGMREFLVRAKGAGLRLALCTNRSDSVRKVLDHFDLPFFDPVITVTQAPPKPDPHGLLSILQIWGAGREEVAYVGDSLVDEQAGRAANIPFVAFKNPGLAAALHVDNYAAFARTLFGD